MRRNRLILLALWIVSLVGISFIGGPITYGFFWAVTMIFVVAFLYLLYVYLFFRIYQRQEGKDLVCGQPTPFYFTLQNENFLTFSGIRVSFFSNFSKISGLDENAEYELLPHTGIKKETVLICKYRGEYEIGIKNVIIQDFFRLFTVSYKNHETLRVYVHPAIVDVEDLRSAKVILDVTRDSYTDLSIPDVVVRNYLPGDDYRRINWKATAKQNELQVRKMIGEQQYGIGILMDSMRYYDDEEAYIPVENKILETTLALSLYFAKKNMKTYVGCISQEYVEFPVDKLDDFEALYAYMCKYRFTKESDQTALFTKAIAVGSVYSDRLVIMVLHEWTNAAFEMASILNDNNISVLAYVITDDPKDLIKEAKLARTQIVVLSIESDLKEVL